MTSGGVLQKIMVSLYVWKNGFELTNHENEKKIFNDEQYEINKELENSTTTKQNTKTKHTSKTRKYTTKKTTTTLKRQ